MKAAEDITLDWIYARVVEDDDGCLLWNCACGGGGKLPQARIGGKAMVMRRVIWELVYEKPIPSDRRVSPGCKKDKCIHPDHMKAQKINAVFRGVKRSLTHKANIAKARRASSKWSEDEIRAIKASDEPIDVLAERHGMDRSYVHYIQRDRARRDYSSPFAGLGARA